MFRQPKLRQTLRADLGRVSITIWQAQIGGKSLRTEWTSFKEGIWEKEINVRDFIQKNYTPYDGDEAFLVGPTERTKELWAQVMDLSEQERQKGGVLDMDTKIISTITSHGPGYLDKDKETIVGFQTDKPFKRSLQPYGGIRMAIKACEENGYQVDPQIVEFFTKHRKTHNDGVFDAYTPGDAGVPLQPYHHGTAGCLWERPHHRRLQKSGAVWSGPPDRGQAEPEGLHKDDYVL